MWAKLLCALFRLLNARVCAWYLRCYYTLLVLTIGRCGTVRIARRLCRCRRAILYESYRPNGFDMTCMHITTNIPAHDLHQLNHRRDQRG